MVTVYRVERAIYGYVFLIRINKVPKMFVNGGEMLPIMIRFRPLNIVSILLKKFVINLVEIKKESFCVVFPEALSPVIL